MRQLVDSLPAIGSGRFGSVYKGILNLKDREVTVKVLNLQQKGDSKSFIAECQALRSVRHRNLVKILTYCSIVDHKGYEFKALVFEFMANMSLESWLHPPHIGNTSQSWTLKLSQRLNIAIDVALPSHYLHNHCERPVIHCDSKPSNVLLDNDMTAHVSDFGLARLLLTNNVFSQHQTSTFGLKGSVGYAAPEYGISGEASKEGDVYSYGILVLEMFTGKRLTDKMFKDGMNLQTFVKKALPEMLMEIVDPTLLPRELEETEMAAAAEDNSYSDDGNGIEAEEETSNNENLSRMSASVQK